MREGRENFLISALTSNHVEGTDSHFLRIRRHNYQRSNVIRFSCNSTALVIRPWSLVTVHRFFLWLARLLYLFPLWYPLTAVVNL